MTIEAGTDLRTLQQFLPTYPCKEELMHPRVDEVADRGVLHDVSELRDHPWVCYRIQDGEKEPAVWKVKQVMISLKTHNRLPIPRLHSVVARIVLDSVEIKFFVSQVYPNRSVGNLLMIGFCVGVLNDVFQTQCQKLS